jgi:hypothetical protein
MGLLDDAIKEHLDLKRRRGADPGEVERDEREALGPVRRNREAPEASDPDGGLDADGLAYDQASEEDWDREPEDSATDTAQGDPGLPPLELSGRERLRSRFRRGGPTRPPEPEPAIEDPALEEDDIFDEPAVDEPEVPPASPPSFATGPTGAETAEYDVEEALASDEPSDEDVLEETPEFLQDTPDHDRLWFEQRPPKDFDFDG